MDVHFHFQNIFFKINLHKNMKSVCFGDVTCCYVLPKLAFHEIYIRLTKAFYFDSFPPL